jgi:ABC-type nitrate/sulfonate/bicarbonate transport system substrate-binding protein
METKKIKIGIVGAFSLNYLPMHLERDLGVFAGMKNLYGYLIETVPFFNYETAQRAMLGNDLDYVACMTSEAIRARVLGKTMVGLLSFIDSPGAAMLVRSDLTDVNSPASLKGKTMAVVDDKTPHHLALMCILRNLGMKPGDIKLKMYGSMEKVMQVFDADDGPPPDVLVCDEPYVSALVAQGKAKILIDLYDKKWRDKLLKTPFSGAGLFTERKNIIHNFKEVRIITGSVMRIFLRVLEADNPVEMVKKNLPASYDMMFGDSILHSIRRVGACLSAQGNFRPEAVDGTINAMKSVGMLPRDFDKSPQIFYDNTVYLNRQTVQTTREEIDLSETSD